MGNLTKNFSSSEFECTCGCGQSKMNPKFMERLQTFRTVMDIPMSIAKGGGYRCEESSKSKTSAHGEGRAADPMIDRYLLHKAVSVATNLGFTGIGIKNKKGSFQLHLDDAAEIPGKRPRPYIWTY